MARTIDSLEVPCFGFFEKGFTQAGAYENPYRDAEAHATLVRPDGRSWTIPLFWDGEKDWKLRVSPDLAGEWSFTVQSPDAGLNGQKGSFRCAPSRLRGSIQPMKGHPLHFQYQDGSPMWFFGDKAWRVLQTDLSKKLGRASAMHHVDVRAVLSPGAGPFSLSRFDPRTGESVELAGPAGGSVRLEAPDAQDWVFLVRKAAR